jgi:hypothetical protein
VLIVPLLGVCGGALNRLGDESDHHVARSEVAEHLLDQGRVELTHQVMA